MRGYKRDKLESPDKTTTSARLVKLKMETSGDLNI